MVGRVILRMILACGVAAFVAGTLIVLFTFDWETVGGGLLVSLFTFPSIVFFAASRFSRLWSRYAVAFYVVPGFIALSFFAVPALTASEGRELATLLGAVLFASLVIMLPVSAVLTVSNARADEERS